MSYSDTVVKGAQSLDTFVGKVEWLTEDWREKINLDSLNMSSLNNCILGQLHPKNDYDEALYDIRKVDDDFDSYPFGGFTSEWVVYLRENNKFSTGSQWVSKTSSRTMTIQGSIEIEGMGRHYVYLSDQGTVWTRSSDSIESKWKPMEKMPKFELGQEIVFPSNTFGGDRFYYIGNKSGQSQDMLRTGKDTFVVTSLREYASYYGTPTIGSHSRTQTLNQLKAALNGN